MIFYSTDFDRNRILALVNSLMCENTNSVKGISIEQYKRLLPLISAFDIYGVIKLLKSEGDRIWLVKPIVLKPIHEIKKK